VRESENEDLCERLRRLDRLVERGYPPTRTVDRTVVEECNDILSVAHERGLPVRELIGESDQPTAAGLRILMTTARAAIGGAPLPPRRTSASLRVRLPDD
jgi:hypothetical protein